MRKDLIQNADLRVKLAVTEQKLQQCQAQKTIAHEAIYSQPTNSALKRWLHLK